MTKSHRDGADADEASRRNANVAMSPPRSPSGRIDALLDILPVGVFTVGPDQRVRLMNEQAGRIAGIAPKDAVGKLCRDVMRCVFCAETCAAQEAQKLGEVRRDFAVDVQRPDGQVLSLKIDAAPLGGGEVAVTLRDVTEAERLRRALRDRWVFHGIVGVSAAVKQVIGQIRDVAPYDSIVLIVGEGGTGKELSARAIHAESPRAGKPFVTVNCSAYSASLLESELFGHVRGAYPGAERDRAGRLETAEGGTLFLDEVADVGPSVQARLLRALQEREVERVGEARPRPVDVRIIAATTRDLQREVAEGRFREDLFYRLNVFTLRIPPLRDRKEDVPVLVDYLLHRSALRASKDVSAVSDEALERLVAHSWPGNVRELENVVENAVVRCRGTTLRASDLPPDFATASAGATPAERIRDALRRAAGSVSVAANLLGIHRTTLWRWMHDNGVRRDDFLPSA